MLDNFHVSETNWQDACQEKPGFGISESPSYVARGIARLASDASMSRFAGRTLTSYQLATLYDLVDVDGSKPDCWGLIEAYGSTDVRSDIIARFRKW